MQTSQVTASVRRERLSQRHNTLSLRHTLRRERIRHVRTNDLLSKRREGPPHSTKYLISERLRSEPKTHQESVRRERPSAEQHALAVAHTHANSLSHGECQTRATFGGARGSHFQQNTSSKGEWSGAIKRVRRHQGSVVPSRVRRECSIKGARRRALRHQGSEYNSQMRKYHYASLWKLKGRSTNLRYFLGNNFNFLQISTTPLQPP
jgi:hypothetical protein